MTTRSLDADGEITESPGVDEDLTSALAKVAAGTHDDSMTKMRKASPSLAASMNLMPSSPCTLAISCGSLTTEVVP